MCEEATDKSGGKMTVKLLALVAVPPGVVTVMVPVVAVVGTAVVICVLEFTVKVALTPLNFTVEAELKFVPVIMTLVFVSPLVGLKLLMTGTGQVDTVKLTERVVLPFPLVVLLKVIVSV